LTEGVAEFLAMIFITHLLLNLIWKNFKNQSAFGEITSKNIVSPFRLAAVNGSFFAPLYTQQV